MTTTYSGGCVCRSVRYEINAEPVAMNDCQCRQCQMDSGTGHSSYLTFVGVEAKVSGAIKCFDVTGDGGTVKSRVFCPDCGTQLYIQFPAMPGVFAVRAGSLDDPELYAPQFVIWSAGKRSWDHVDPTLPSFAKMPPQPGTT